MTPDIALAASAREWPDRLHRFLVDHGGAVVVARVMSSDEVLDTGFDVVFIDDVCSFLTPRLIAELRHSGKQAVGVFDPDDGSDAKRRLLECGISDVIESDATPAEFLDMALSAKGHLRPGQADRSSSARPLTIGVLGTNSGVGVTEIAVAIADVGAESMPIVLVDLDPRFPSVAQRLDLPLHPSIRSALDAVVHQTSALEDCLQQLENLAIVAGVADNGAAGEVTATDAGLLIQDLGSVAKLIVCDLGAFEGAKRGLLRSMDAVIVVGSGDPVGVSRLVRTTSRLDGLVDPARVLLAVNHVPKGRFKESEIRRELAASWPRTPVVLIPSDRRVGEAAWEGRRVAGGRFHKAVRRVGELAIREVDRGG